MNKAVFRGALSALILAMIGASALAATSTQRPVHADALRAQPVASSAAQLEAPTVMLLQDVAPWDSTANETILNNLGVAFAKVSSAELAAMSAEALDLYAVVIVSSDQPQAFYDVLKDQMGKLGKWVKTGARTLEFHAADNGWNGGTFSGTLPKGVTTYDAHDLTNMVVRPKWSLMKGVPTTLSGSWASHNGLNVEAPIKTIVTDMAGNPTLVDYCWKQGRVIASGMTLEIAHDLGWDAAKVLENLIAASTSAPGCQHKDPQ
ncbi:hypothetical protein [Ideonella dechloratans]|uniref:hypothetical protein n=1 Tax=Ideonella dechloratans TaxID=36863 RepID=UPI0035AEDF4F